MQKKYFGNINSKMQGSVRLFKNAFVPTKQSGVAFYFRKKAGKVTSMNFHLKFNSS